MALNSYTDLPGLQPTILDKEWVEDNLFTLNMKFPLKHLFLAIHPGLATTRSVKTGD